MCTIASQAQASLTCAEAGLEPASDTSRPRTTGIASPSPTLVRDIIWSCPRDSQGIWETNLRCPGLHWFSDGTASWNPLGSFRKDHASLPSPELLIQSAWVQPDLAKGFPRAAGFERSWSSGYPSRCRREENSTSLGCSGHSLRQGSHQHSVLSDPRLRDGSTEPLWRPALRHF